VSVRLVPPGVGRPHDGRQDDAASRPSSPTPPPRAAAGPPAIDSSGTALQASRLLSDLDDRFANLARAARRVRDQADDEAVHDLRVASRRLIAAGDVWRDALRSRSARALRGRLRGLRRRAGAVRDLEVHVARLRELRDALAGPARELAAYALGGLEPEAAVAVERIRRRLRPRSLRPLAARYERATRALRRRPGDAFVPAMAARAELERRSTQARIALRPALDSGYPELLHAARVAVKKWRYAAEALSSIGLLPSDVEPVRALRKLQQSLGRIQDASTLTARLEAALPAGSSRAALLGELARESAESLASARIVVRDLRS
jgi:CHAD domain-containing protein